MALSAPVSPPATVDVGLEPMDGLGGLIALQARRVGNSVALLGPGGASMTYGQLEQFIVQTGDALAARRLGLRDRVALVLPDPLEMASAFLGIAAHAVAAPLNPAFTREDFEFYLQDLGARALVVGARDNSSAREAARRLSIPLMELESSFDTAGWRISWLQNPGAGAGNGVPHPFGTGDAVALVLHTSGTTARPKRVPLTHRNLLSSAAAISKTLALGPSDRALNVMPLFHIHGLVGVLLSSLASGGTVICLPKFEAEGCLDALEGYRPTWYSAVPTMHAALVRSAEGRGLDGLRHSLRFIRSASAALPSTTLRALEALFGVPVIEAYGMTEAAHQMASNPLPPGVRKLGSVGRAAGPEVVVLDEAHRPLSPNQKGEIGIRGPNVTAGYDENLDANAQAFAGGWFHTGDIGWMDEDGYLFISARLKEIINRGGEKISPREIDDALLEHPSVAQAVAFSLRHPTLGDDLAAAVVAKPKSRTDESELREFLANRLPGFKVPTRIVVVDEIPKTATGKVQRLGLEDRLAEALAVSDEPPQGDVERLVATIFAEVLGVTAFGRHEDFFYRGGDSIRAMQAVARLTSALGFSPPRTLVFRRPTVASLSLELSKLIEERETQSLLAALEQLGANEAESMLGNR